MYSLCYSQEKNVKKDALQGKIGNIYIPDQKVRMTIFHSLHLLFELFPVTKYIDCSDVTSLF